MRNYKQWITSYASIVYSDNHFKKEKELQSWKAQWRSTKPLLTVLSTTAWKPASFLYRYYYLAVNSRNTSRQICLRLFKHLPALKLGVQRLDSKNLPHLLHFPATHWASTICLSYPVDHKSSNGLWNILEKRKYINDTNSNLDELINLSLEWNFTCTRYSDYTSPTEMIPNSTSFSFIKTSFQIHLKKLKSQ